MLPYLSCWEPVSGSGRMCERKDEGGGSWSVIGSAVRTVRAGARPTTTTLPVGCKRDSEVSQLSGGQQVCYSISNYDMLFSNQLEFLGPQSSNNPR